MKLARSFALTILVALGFTTYAETVTVPANTNWLSYNHNVNGQRYVPLDQINTANASSLGEICKLKIDDAGAFHTSILHLDGTLYFTTATDTIAVDSTNCQLRWRHQHAEHELDMTAIRVNRGLAYANGRLYRGTVDSRLLAIDAATGATIWEYQVGDPQLGEFFSASPQIYQGLVIIGAAGGDWGIRGRVMAFDADTGREVWRFHTIPRGDEPGADSWVVADSARFGGGGTWTTYTLDVSTGELFVPVGNPAPDLIPDQRPGENLYTDSLVVLDAATGKLKWYHQLLSNDGQDLDLGAAPVLYHNDDSVPIVAFGSKDGYVYGVNRETRERIFKTQITTIKNAGVAPTTEGIEVCPGPLGGVEWNGPAYDKPNKALIVGSVDWCAILAADESYKYRAGQFNMGGTFKFNDQAGGWIYSLDANTGAVRWKRKTEGPQVAGITPTAGGVVFTGDLGGNFFALETDTGKILYETKVSGGLAGGVISYMRDGRQYVAFVSGNVSRLTFGDTGSPTLNIFALDAPPPAAAVQATADAGAPVTAPDPAAGKITYGKICAMCHGGQGEGATGPTLSGLGKRMEHARVVEWIKNPSTNMPRLFPSMLNEQQVHDVAAYARKF